jgi:hypothetical protein
MNFNKSKPKGGLMTERVSSQMISAIRTLFFERLAQINKELIEAHGDIAQEISVQNHYSVLSLLAEVEARVETMQTISLVLRECLGG